MHSHDIFDEIELNMVAPEKVRSSNTARKNAVNCFWQHTAVCHLGSLMCGGPAKNNNKQTKETETTTTNRQTEEAEILRRSRCYENGEAEIRSRQLL